MWDYAIRKIDEWVFETEVPGKSRSSVGFSTLALVAIFLAGTAHWVIFLNLGRGGFGADWSEFAFFYGVVERSIRTLEIPYFVPTGISFFGDNFLGNLQYPASPQYALVVVMGTGKFILVNALIMYSVGFLGCLLIRHRYKLSLVPFFIFFLLFNFNGHIISHISVGHPWWGYFLLPFFLLLVLELADEERQNKLGPTILLAFVMFGILLQGSFHVFLWCGLFLLVLGLFNRSLSKWAGYAILASLLLLAFRFLPSMFFYSDYIRSYASGFPTFPIFIDSLTTIKSFQFEHPSGALYDVGWWEINVFIGYVGVAFIAYFGIYQRLSSNPEFAKHKFRALDLPILLLTLFSFGLFFDLLSDLRLPFFSWAERVPMRFFIIPMLMLALISSIRMQEFLPKLYSSVKLKALTVAALVEMAHSFVAHSWFWRVPGPGRGGSGTKYPGFSSLGNLDLGAVSFQSAVSQQDDFYKLAFHVGLVISAATLLGLCWIYYTKVWRVGRQ